MKEDIDDGLHALTDYFHAAIEGQERPEVLIRLWKQQMTIMIDLLENEK